jgi:hypothetical protein
MSKRIIEKQFENCDSKKVNFFGNTIPGYQSGELLLKLISIKSKVFSSLELKSGVDKGALNGLTDYLMSIDFSKFVSGISDNLFNPEVYKLISEIIKLSSAKIDGKELSDSFNFDDIFSGDIPLLLEVVAYILFENYGNIFKKKHFLNIGKMWGISEVLRNLTK